MRFNKVEQMEAEIAQLKEEYYKAFDAGGLKERAKIVEWLRWMDDPADYADMIEAGEHLNMPPPTN